MERRQTAERQCKTLIVFSVLSFASASGMSGTGGLSVIIFLKAVVQHLKGRLDAVIDGLCDIVAAFGRLKAATQGVVLGDQAVWAELVRLLDIVQEQSQDLLAIAKEATGAIKRSLKK